MSINIKIPGTHHAFRVEYEGVMGILFTDIIVGIPMTDDPPMKKLANFRGIWDTGATNTVITKAVVDAINLIPSGKAEVSGVNSCKVTDTYIIDLYLPNKIRLPNWRVIESDINSPGIDILIGMDVIHNGDFSINNGLGYTVFMFAMPPFEHFDDYVEKSNAINQRKIKTNR
jgi:predicted aspartyl protease